MNATMRGCVGLVVGLLCVGPASRAMAAGDVGPAVPMTRQEAGLVITVALTAPVAVEGTGPQGQPLFLAPGPADRFLAVDLRGARGNKNGFGVGEFIPYLTVAYALQRQGSPESRQGALHPLVTAQGLRYGNNVTLAGPGTCTLTLTIESPLKVGFGRHTDLETGVARWWKPFQAEWTITCPPAAR